jgi:uncharacterized protein (TIGR03437 family)
LGGQILRIASTLYRGAASSVGLALLLAAALPLAAQNPVIAVHNTLQFAHQTGAAAPPPQTMRVYSAPANVQFAASVSTTAGGSWLFVNSGLTFNGFSGVTGQRDLVISVSPNLAAGTYSGNVAIVAGQTTVNVPVTYTVSPNPVVRLDPSSLVDTPVEALRTSTIPVSVVSSGAPTPFSAAVVNANPPTGWLTVLPDQGTAQSSGSSVTLVVNAGALPQGTALAMAAVRFTTVGGSVTLPISVAVTPGAQLQISPTTVNFPYQVGFTAPTPRMVNVTSTTQTQLGYTASITTASPWLTLSTVSQTTPGTLSVSGTTPGQLWLIPNVAAVSQAPGTHEATVRIESTTGSVQTLTARLVISNQPQLTISQDASSFVYTLGGLAPAAQTITVGSTSFPQTITVTPTYTSGGTWFTVTPPTGTTPQNVTITVDPTRLSQLSAGTYTGSVRVQSSTSDITIPVSLTISGSALISVEPLNPEPFTWQPGQPTPPERTLIVRSTDSTNQPFTVNVEYGTGATGWLVLSATSGSTGTTGTVLRMNVNTTAVTVPGTYTANIVITPTGVASAPAVRIPVTYILSGSAQVTASVSRIEATQIGTTIPAVQTVTLNSATPGLTFIATPNQPWIRVTPTSGSIPGSIQVSFDSANLTPGDYSGSIVVTVGGAQTLTIPVALRVQSSATLQVAPSTTLNFTAVQNSPAPAAQTLNLTSTGVPISFTATATSTVGNTNWLRVQPASGTTPAALQVSVDATGLAPGTYNGVVTINSSNASNATTTVNVNLTVTAQATPAIRSLINAASGLARGVSPGMIATIFGTNLAPTTQTFGTVTNGVVNNTLAEVQVLFDNIPAPILYAGPGGGQDQINVVVPYGVGGRQSTSVVVSYRGVRSAPVTYQVADAIPGIFTIPSGGTGQGAILNQNNSVNSLSNPARRGEIIQIYATGEGAVFPAVTEGRIIPAVAAELRRPVGTVQVQLGGRTLTPEYAGSAPGLVTGAMQVNVRIPADLPVAAPQNLAITVSVGNMMSQPGVTVAVAP